MVRATVSARGELVIPKHMREEIGIEKNATVFLEVRDKVLHVRRIEGDPILRMEERAKRNNVDVSKWVRGNQLYEEEFGRKWEGKIVSRR
ncbi:MAG: AbrB/MazE/SpoVT family DNA-binding domain-containing protein [Nanoarchaeota archaeon]